MSQYAQDDRCRYFVQETASSGELLTVGQAKAQLGICHHMDDSEILAKLTAARAFCEGHVGRTFRTSVTRALTMDKWPDVDIVLPSPPAISVASVEYEDTDAATQTLSAAEYNVSLSEPGAITWADGFTRPDVEAGNTNAIVVTWTSGYATFPPDVVEAAKLVLTWLFDYDQTPALLELYHKRALQLLERYKVWSYA